MSNVAAAVQDDVRPSAHVYGASLSISWADPSRNLMDLIFEAVSAALRDARVTISQVDSVVLGAHDLIDGRSLSSMVTAPAAGGYLRDEIRLSEDGLAALSLASARVEAGESSVSIVAAWGRASEGGFMPMSRSSMDPFTEQPFGLSDIEISSFRLSRWLAAHGGADAARSRAAQVRRARASANPRALHGRGGTFPASFPLRGEEMPVWADIVAAVIVGREESQVRVAGVGHGTDTPQVGARDLLGMPALKTAVEAATASAGIQLGDVGTIELDGMTLSDEVIALEALGLCAPGEGFSAYSGNNRINLSGGGAGGWCYPAMGLVRFAEAYRRLRDGVSASARGRKAALATGYGSNGAQTSTAVILEAL